MTTIAIGSLMVIAAMPGLWYAVYDELKLRNRPLTADSFFAVGVVVLVTIFGLWVFIGVIHAADVVYGSYGR